MVKLVILPKEENDGQRARRNNLHHFPFHRLFFLKGGLRASVLDPIAIKSFLVFSWQRRARREALYLGTGPAFCFSLLEGNARLWGSRS